MYIGHHSPLYHIFLPIVPSPLGLEDVVPTLVPLIGTMAKALSDDKFDKIIEIPKQIVRNLSLIHI